MMLRRNMSPFWSVALLLGAAACARTPSADPAARDTSVIDSKQPPTETSPPDDPPPRVLPTVAVTVESEGVLTCTQPTARDAAPYRLLPPLPDEPIDPASNSLFVGGGITVDDLDGDGHLDLVLTARDDRVALYLHDPSTKDPSGLGWIDASDRLPDLPQRTATAASVDLEGDGDIDLFMTVFRGFDVLLRNDGAGQFTADPNAAGMDGDMMRRSMGASFADIDGDEDLDVFLSAYGALTGDTPALPDGDASAVYFQEPGGGFSWPTEELWLPPHPMGKGHTFQAAFSDVDGDSRPDVFVVNDFGWSVPTLLLRNIDGELLVDQRDPVALQFENMGLGIGDLNRDGIDDFAVAAWDRLSLVISQPEAPTADPVWFDEAIPRGFQTDPPSGRHVPWGTAMADLDNDGDLDIAVGYGHLPVTASGTNPLEQPDAVYVQQDDGSFLQQADAWGMANPGRTRGVLATDLDHDGWLDVLWRDLRGPLKIFHANCGDAAWLGLRLRQPGMNPRGIGAVVTVWTHNTTRTQQLRAGGTGYTTAGPQELHLGLGEAQHVDRIEVVWPDGEVSVVEDVDPKQWLTLVRHDAPYRGSPPPAPAP